MADIKITYVNLNSLKTYQNNPKDHPQKQVHQIADSIKKFGFNNPILTKTSAMLFHSAFTWRHRLRQNLPHECSFYKLIKTRISDKICTISGVLILGCSNPFTSVRSDKNHPTFWLEGCEYTE